jgi:hypothetical protein
MTPQDLLSLNTYKAINYNKTPLQSSCYGAAMPTSMTNNVLTFPDPQMLPRSGGICGIGRHTLIAYLCFILKHYQFSILKFLFVFFSSKSSFAKAIALPTIISTFIFMPLNASTMPFSFTISAYVVSFTLICVVFGIFRYSFLLLTMLTYPYSVGLI